MIEWSRVTVPVPQEVQSPWKIRLYEFLLPELNGIPRHVMGIDPGRNFGAAVIWPSGLVRILYGNLHRRRDASYAEDGWEAYTLIRLYCYDAPWSLAVGVEGAAHSNHYGQANLAYIREGFYLGVQSLRAGLAEIQMVPVQAARKDATGSGNIPVWRLLPDMNENAADALGIAVYLAMKDLEEVTHDKDSKK